MRHRVEKTQRRAAALPVEKPLDVLPVADRVRARWLAERRRRRAWAAGLVAILVANGLVALACCVNAGMVSSVLFLCLATGLALTLVLAVVLALEWRLGDRLLAATDTARRRVDRLAHRDSLTGLANRRALSRGLQRGVVAAGQGAPPFDLHLIDVDGLKRINDGFGHAVGDDVLQTVAQRLRATVRQTDVVARIGGDEFAILQTGATPATAARLASRVVEALRRPMREHRTPLVPTVSVGTAHFGADGTTPAELMGAADGALYAAKNDGRDRWVAAGGAGITRPAPPFATL